MTAPASRRALLCGIAALPATGCAALAEVPTSLALACRNAIEQAIYINTTAFVEGWDDQRLDEESDRYDELFRRAIYEPSKGLPDLQAKARLALDDFERHRFAFRDPALNAEAEAALDDDERLIRVALREVIALA